MFRASESGRTGASGKLSLVRRGRLIALAVPLLLFLVGCGYSDPYSNSGPQSSVSTTTPSASTTGSKGDPFSMGENAKLVRLPNGLAYADIKVGKGALAQANDSATLDYTLYSASGQFLQTSIGSSTGPFTTELSSADLIPGFVQGVEGMRVGGIRRIEIPQDLGYGSSPPSGIPAGTLVFIVRLHAITKASPSPSSTPS